MQERACLGREEMSCCGPVEFDKPMAYLLEMAEATDLGVSGAQNKDEGWKQ